MASERITVDQHFARGKAEAVARALRSEGLDAVVAERTGSYRVNVPAAEADAALSRLSRLDLVVTADYDAAHDEELPIISVWAWFIPAFLLSFLFVGNVAVGVLAWVVGAVAYKFLHKPLRRIYHPWKRRRRERLRPSR